MSGPKAASKAAGGGGPAVPAGDRKLISTVKEVATSHSEEEIYAMLKECSRDPNEAVARLLNEDKFHVVTRKRDKKKETGITKEASDSRQGNSGSFGRNGRSMGTSGSRGPGRGTSSFRTNNNAEGSGGRSKVTALKENGISSLAKTPSSTAGGSLSYSQLVQPKASFSSTLNGLPSSSGISNGDTRQATMLPSLEGVWPASAGFGTSTSALQGAWLAGSGHGTIADMLKGGTRKPSVDVVPSAVSVSTSLEQLSVSSMHIAPLDPAVSLPFDSHTRSPNSVVKNREIGAEGIPRYPGDVSSYGFQDGDSAHYGLANSSSALPVERDVALLQPSDLNLSVPLEEHVQSASGFTSGQSRTLGIPDTQEGQTGGLGNQFSGAPVYQTQQFTEIHQDSTSVDWSAHLISHEEAAPNEVQLEGAVRDDSALPSTIAASAAKLQEMSVRDNLSVIIPDHIRVSEADCTTLSFGSFDVGFDGLSSNPTLIAENQNQSFSVSEGADVSDLTVALRSMSSSIPTTSASWDHEQPISSVSVQTLHTSADVNAIDDETVIKEEEDLPEEPAQHEYPPSYSGMSAVSSDHTSHYAAASEETDSRPRDVSAVMPPYDNSTYYSGVFRSVPELDSRYSAFSQLAASGKLGMSRPAKTTAQSASQEVVNASVYPSSNSMGGPAMPAVNNGPSAMTHPQQSIHPYATQPSGLPLGSFANVLGYHYMPPGFPYVQSPYQHNYVGTGNYHQMPTAVGAGAMKYPVPQYKTGAVVSGMHNTVSPSSLGYGGYPSTQPTANLPATSGNTSTFDDSASQHYKDNTMYMPSQQIDGPSVWLQSQLAREAQTQGNSYYDVPSQNQPSRYSQTQSLLTHTHPAAMYGNLYHPQQSGSSSSAHQLLQQQQALGSMGALGSQIGSYQQNQRAQPTWAPGPY